MNEWNARQIDTPAALAFDFDARYCSGCKACQVACKDKHDLEVGRLWRRVYEISGGEWIQQGAAWTTTTFAYNLSIACNHCAQPICVEVCPSGAMHQRNDGIVLVDQEICLGCGYCAWACPYTAPQLDTQRKVMSKCTLCYDELEQGKPPACVAACPMRVLNIIPADQRALQANQPVLPDPSLTRPRLALTPHPSAIQAGHIANYEETGQVRISGKAPLMLFTILAQTAAGLWTMLSLLGASLAVEERDAILPGLVLALALLLMAMLASSAHLGHPRRAWRALANLRQSWLSREILFTVTSSAIWALNILLLATWPTSSLPMVMGLAAGSISGLALVYSMSRVYSLRTIPAWNSPLTLRSFISTALTPGAPLAGALLIFGPSITPVSQASMAYLAGMYSLALLFLEMIDFQRWVTTSKIQLVIHLRPWIVAPLGLAALCSAWIVFVGAEQLALSRINGIVFVCAALFSLIGLALRRYCFYQNFQRTGL